MPSPERFSKRLHLVAAKPEHLRVELDSLEELSELLGAEIPPDWPPGEYDRQAQEFFLDSLMKGGTSAEGWYTWYAMTRDAPDQHGVVIGAAGFLGPPNDSGDVEIGYSIVPAWRGKGLASEIVNNLVAFAFEDARVQRVFARTTVYNQPSCRVLEHAGFRSMGLSEENDDLRYVCERTPTLHITPHSGEPVDHL
jgi:[ribosomal protein S5]-alanine N-acetyltransferase